MRPRAWALAAILPLTLFGHPCESCHPKQVSGYLKTGMGQSLRSPGNEPTGAFEHLKSGSRFLVAASRGGLFQRMEHGGRNSDYRIDYVIGSGSHASCYIAALGDHLFESPICYYPARGFGMAPGFEDNPAPGYTRPITPECLFCHSGRALPVPNSINRFQSPAFAEEAISCERCHGDSSAHLKRPVPGSIVNPAKLTRADRDSVCEQCHLAGVIRVSNPGKTPADFHPGQALEDVLTTYIQADRPAGTSALRVVSQSEQLALSQCALQSRGRMWCGTCHDPHEKPASPAAYFRARCLSCHTRPFTASHPSRTSDCLPCHMRKRETYDGAHTAFTDHRITRQAAAAEKMRAPAVASLGGIRAWREPAPALRARNVALALNYVGLRDSSDSQVALSYPLLAEVQKRFPTDPDVLTGIGQALLRKSEPAAAVHMFERAIELRPADPAFEDNAGRASLDAGNPQAASHFERALALDPLLLPDIEALLRIYRASGESSKEADLMRRVNDAMKTGPRPSVEGR